MNHWFLVGRDLMWLVVGLGPILFGVVAGGDAQRGSGGTGDFIIAIVWQSVLIACLYTGVIR